ncbi:hypothetical protein LOC71_22265 [Rhodopirellula sp. JC740]|uniref:Uncharacterized protein n=1 Tax=Rhodopirellula halodulae TaxID=2894198 RepID=A0ABS8NRC2_9BACT|nr:hypothetical protein [Rhodopirellula sp. JC740]MCC9645011.1 hypothetical protein [Rhodopirellula sp. JC740]
MSQTECVSPLCNIVPSNDSFPPPGWLARELDAKGNAYLETMSFFDGFASKLCSFGSFASLSIGRKNYRTVTIDYAGLRFELEANVPHRSGNLHCTITSFGLADGLLRKQIRSLEFKGRGNDKFATFDDSNLSLENADDAMRIALVLIANDSLSKAIAKENFNGLLQPSAPPDHPIEGSER